MPGRRRALRWSAGPAALVVVLAAAGSAPTRTGPAGDDALYAQCRRALRQLAEQHRTAETASVAVRCARPDGSIVDPALWSPAVSSPPAPVRPVTAGRAGCVTGPDRPVIGTTHFRVSATAGPGEELVYEHGPLDSGDLVDSSGSPVLEFGPGDLAPGVTYHWRARVDDPAAWTDPAEDDRGWSPWCEFSVSAGAVD